MLAKFVHLPQWVYLAVSGLCELSAGCTAANGNAMLLAAVCGLGGLCSAMQVKAALGSEISVKPYLAVRAVSGVFMSGLAYFFLTK